MTSPTYPRYVHAEALAGYAIRESMRWRTILRLTHVQLAAVFDTEVIAALEAWGPTRTEPATVGSYQATLVTGLDANGNALWRVKVPSDKVQPGYPPF